MDTGEIMVSWNLGSLYCCAQLLCRVLFRCFYPWSMSSRQWYSLSSHPLSDKDRTVHVSWLTNEHMYSVLMNILVFLHFLLLISNGHTGLMDIITVLIWQLHGINCVLIYPLNSDSVSGLCDYIRGCVYVDQIHRSTARRAKQFSKIKFSLSLSLTQPNHP